MANTKTFTRSFAGGELSAEMFGRIDDAKYQSGAAMLRNFIATPQGPAQNRPGFAYVNATKNNGVARLISFVYSSTQTMVVELGNQYIRFHTQGETLETAPGVPYEISSPYLAVDLFDIHYVQSADVMTLVHPSYPPMELRRLGALNWTLTVISFGAVVDTPTGVAVTATPGFKAQIASISGATITTASNHTLALGDPVYVDGLIDDDGPTDRSGFYQVSFVPVDGMGDLIPNELQLTDYNGVLLDTTSWSGYTLSPGTIQYGTQIFDINNNYAVAALAADNVSQSLLSATVTALNNLDVPGSFNVITWDAVAGAPSYYVFKEKNGLWGFIGEAVGTIFNDNNIAPDFSITPVNLDDPFSGVDNYPAAVGYIEQRRCFAGTNNDPQTLWMTNSGTESTFAYSLPSEDTDRISIKVAAREVSSILHIIPLTQLILLTGSCEYGEYTANGGPITPSSIGIRPQSYIGASTVQPSVINTSLVYCAARGGHVREMGYSWQANGFVTGDLSLRSANLFDLLTIQDQAFSKAPLPIVWFVSSNGDLLGLTYVPEQQIGAWHHHDTDGTFESIATVAEGSEERLYAVVRREIKSGKSPVSFTAASPTVVTWTAHGLNNADPVTFQALGTYPNPGVLTPGVLPSGVSASATYTVSVIDADHIHLLDALGNPVAVTDAGYGSFFGYSGTQTVRYVERMASRLVGALKDCFFVDAGVTYPTEPSDPVPVTTIGGLDWLEGETVAVLADGAVQNQKMVTNGTILLDHPASVVQIGLPYTSDLQTLPPTLQVDGFGQGRQLNVNKVWIRLFQSSGIFAGPSEDLLTEYKQRTTEVYGAPPDLQSGQAEITLMPQWNDNGQILLRQENPLPLTVVAVTMEMAIGG